MSKQWNYLASEPFQARYLLVAGLLRRFEHVLELGSYKTPLFRFVDDPSKHILAVDPLVFEAEASPTQRSETMDYRCLSMPVFGGRPYALVMLGLDIPPTAKLERLIREAEIVVVEYPEDHQWKRSRQTYDQLVERLSLNVLLQVHFDLDGNDFSRFGNENEWPPRTQRYVRILSARHKTMSETGSLNPFVEPLAEIDTRGSALLNTGFLAEKVFPEAAYEFSHGANKDKNYLGGGLLYYMIPYMQRSRVCVCLGSGGAFVPRMMRQAQRDIGMAAASRTILVDGNKGGYGRPNWAEEQSFFRQAYPDVEILIADTADGARRLADEGVGIDYLHIDADHSLEGAMADFRNYLPLMRRGSLITYHDTRPHAHESVTCWQGVEEIRKMGFEVVNLDQLGSGVALIKFDRPAAAGQAG